LVRPCDLDARVRRGGHLLKQHILIAVDLIEAAKAGDDAKFRATPTPRS
jgi:hypothetical protein